MGACISSTVKNLPQNRKSSTKLHTDDVIISKSPPQEEESVKEVLSETKRASSFHDMISRNAYGKKQQQHHHLNGALPFILASDQICSTSTAMRENRGNTNNGDFHQVRRRLPARFNNLSFSGDVMGEKTIGRFPGRVSDPSTSRLGPGYNSGRNGDPGWCKSDRLKFGSGHKLRNVEDGKDGGGNTWTPTSNDLLEKSLVSLECFIFL